MNTKNPHSLPCSTATQWMHLLLDRELSPAEHEKLVAHLQTCERCHTAYHELNVIEAAHTELDTSTMTVPDEYFAALPQRVLARLEAAAQPARVPPRILTLKPRGFEMRKFVFGRGKYVLAFAAMFALVFIVTRQMREQGTSEQALREAAQSLPPAAPAEKIISDEPQVEHKTLLQSVAFDSAAIAKPVALPRGAAAESKPEQTVAASSGPARSIPQTQELLAQTESQPRAQTEVVNLAPIAPASETLAETVAAKPRFLADTPQQFPGNPQAESPMVQLEANKAEDRGKELDARAQYSPSAPPRLLAKSSSSKAAQAKSFRMTEHRAANEPRLQQTLSSAWLAQTQAERLKIWQDYFGAAQRDSSSYNAAVEDLARRLGAEADSSHSVTQLQEALSFYQTMAALLVARWGKADYDREKNRLEGLLNWKKSVER